MSVMNLATEAELIINVMDYGALPDSGEDCTMAIRLAIQAASRVNGPVILYFPKGRYDIYSHQAIRVPYNISNTASEEEVSDNIKTIGLYFDRHRQLTIEGNDSLLMYHGKQTMIAFEACEFVTIQNLRIDVANPTMAEMTVLAVGDHYIDVQVHPDSKYEICQDRLFWIGSGWRFHHGYMQEVDLASNTTWRAENLCETASKVEEIAANHLRFHFIDLPTVPVGRILQVRDGIRDQVGSFIHRSRHISWKNVSIHFMHGLGIVSQFSENITFDHIDLSPRTETGRTAAAFADLMHFSSCRGLIKIENSRFMGSHDDAINIHGTHLQIVEVLEKHHVRVRFMHPQTYGLDGFYPGDDIHFVREQTLAVFDKNMVIAVQRISPRELLLTLEKPVPDDIVSGDVIENVTWNPDVEIRNNHFSRIPTRGILATSSGKVVIEDNLFERTVMSGILIANDASSWFESGRVNDVIIRRNRFIECGGREHPVLYIVPENRSVDVNQPVHEHILIEDNYFQLTDSLVLCAKSTRDLMFRNNTMTKTDAVQARNILRLNGGIEMTDRQMDDDTLISLHGCSEVTIIGNKMPEEDFPRQIQIMNMSQQEILTDASQRLEFQYEDA
ncbi:right-handed parallel beta-helix repeat-containing protein [Paenibacillus sp. DMB20]|uniref:right-handed parallel beta-helix repeat-containing protein n=1 Tax=Paenibacillus sp. DMB20 TaxID=1642570 RepID=UPI000627E5FA|nr:right-handed parallel beta-helix repeat-containing protein [Paenibacillus sp. DMB20]KKO53993.1 hypothetical protein XI25_07570 [Paenibacillus sp. DMB20]